MADTPKDDKDPRHHELSEGKGYAASSATPYRVTQNNAGQQSQDDDEKPKFF